MSLWNCEQLTCLEIRIDHGSIKLTLPDALGRLSNLQRLLVEKCGLASLPEAISKLARLQHLCVADNQITQLPLRCDLLLALEHLDVSNNHLYFIAPDVLRLPRLRVVKAGRNKELCNMPERGSFDGLIELDLFATGVQTLNCECFPNLQTLVFGAIPPLPVAPALAECTRLTSLTLTVSGPTLPACVTQLPLLEILNLDDSTITSLPPSLSRLHMLRVLSVNRCPLTDFPPALLALFRLERLFAQQTKVGTLPYFFSALKLQELDLRNNAQLCSPFLPETINSPRRTAAQLRTVPWPATHAPARVVLLGNGGTGRTSLSLALMHRAPTTVKRVSAARPPTLLLANASPSANSTTRSTPMWHDRIFSRFSSASTPTPSLQLVSEEGLGLTPAEPVANLPPRTPRLPVSQDSLQPHASRSRSFSSSRRQHAPKDMGCSRPLTIFPITTTDGTSYFNLWDCTPQCTRCLARARTCWQTPIDSLLDTEDALFAIAISMEHELPATRLPTEEGFCDDSASLTPEEATTPNVDVPAAHDKHFNALSTKPVSPFEDTRSLSGPSTPVRSEAGAQAQSTPDNTSFFNSGEKDSGTMASQATAPSMDTASSVFSMSTTLTGAPVPHRDGLNETVAYWTNFVLARNPAARIMFILTKADSRPADKHAHYLDAVQQAYASAIDEWRSNTLGAVSCARVRVCICVCL
jgi:Leucine-rich repeat (LRR) protein